MFDKAIELLYFLVRLASNDSRMDKAGPGETLWKTHSFSVYIYLAPLIQEGTWAYTYVITKFLGFQILLQRRLHYKHFSDKGYVHEFAIDCRHPDLVRVSHGSQKIVQLKLYIGF